MVQGSVGLTLVLQSVVDFDGTHERQEPLSLLRTDYQECVGTNTYDVKSTVLHGRGVNVLFKDVRDREDQLLFFFLRGGQVFREPCNLIPGRHCVALQPYNRGMMSSATAGPAATTWAPRAKARRMRCVRYTYGLRQLAGPES